MVGEPGTQQLMDASLIRGVPRQTGIVDCVAAHNESVWGLCVAVPKPLF